MAVYTRNEDGSLTAVRVNRSLAEIEAQAQELTPVEEPKSKKAPDSVQPTKE